MAGAVTRDPALNARLARESLERKVRRAEVMAERIRANIVAQGLVDTGRLLAGVGVRIDGGRVFAGIYGVPYAADVEYGTKPHLIEAKPGGVLTNGTKFFGKVVHHPGTHPTYVVKAAAVATQVSD